jgi:hypothetical protein
MVDARELDPRRKPRVEIVRSSCRGRRAQLLHGEPEGLGSGQVQERHRLGHGRSGVSASPQAANAAALTPPGPGPMFVDDSASRHPPNGVTVAHQADHYGVLRIEPFFGLSLTVSWTRVLVRSLNPNREVAGLLAQVDPDRQVAELDDRLCDQRVLADRDGRVGTDGGALALDCGRQRERELTVGGVAVVGRCG